MSCFQWKQFCWNEKCLFSHMAVWTVKIFEDTIRIQNKPVFLPSSKNWAFKINKRCYTAICCGISDAPIRYRVTDLESMTHGKKIKGSVLETSILCLCQIYEWQTAQQKCGTGGQSVFPFFNFCCYLYPFMHVLQEKCQEEPEKNALKMWAIKICEALFGRKVEQS